MAKKCMTVQAQPNLQPAVLVLPRSSPASADPGQGDWGAAPIFLPQKAEQEQCWLVYNKSLLSSPKCPAGHSELLPYARTDAGPAWWPRITEVSVIPVALSNGTDKKICLKVCFWTIYKTALLFLPCFLQSQTNTNPCIPHFRQFLICGPWLFSVSNCSQMMYTHYGSLDALLHISPIHAN